MSAHDDLLRALLVERQRPISPRPTLPDDFRHPSDSDEACARRRRVLVEAMSGFRVRPYRTYRQRTPEEIADMPSLARSRRAA
jgi:hypothetical protein